MTKYVIGVDLGVDGGISLLSSDNNLIDFEIMPTKIKIVNKKEKRIVDISEVVRLFSRWNLDYNIVGLAMEVLSAFPGQSSQTGFSLGYSSGIFESLSVFFNMPCFKYRPVEWQKEMFKGINYAKGQTKSASIQVATSLFPGTDFRASERCRKNHDGLTDSVLIGLYHIKKNL
ncbi:MAG: hypothetical protein M0R03_20600 [Novosphingobium sp.]|nr:hypothetical protein [Novosphingobium sp.]